MNFINSYKEQKRIQSKRNIKITKKDYETAEVLLSQFGIQEDEIENIFDMIAKEHPDL